MDQIASFGSTGVWLNFITALLIAGCLYFTLTYFQYLKQENEELMKKAKTFAVGSLLLALIIPVFYQMYIMWQMMNFNSFD